MLDNPDAQGVAQARKDFAVLAAGWRGICLASAQGVVQAAETQIFNQMVVALEGRFAAVPGAGLDHAGALEVHLLAQGVKADGRFPVSRQWRAGASVTGYHAGDRIALTEQVFSRLAVVFLDGVARRLG